jgi:gliding motility-associated-like protein
MLRKVHLLLLVVLLLWVPRHVYAQSFNFNSGPIPPCDTSYFTATVSGVGYLINPDGYTPGFYLADLWINISTDHPQTLQIFLTSPQGTVLLLSQYNGAGGQNYTNTHFNGWQNITMGTPPFTGNFMPQGGSDLISTFAGEDGSGTWTVTVIDTACANGGTGPAGTWTPGWFSGGAGGGGISFGYDPGYVPPPWIPLGDVTAYLCPGGSVDVLDYYLTNWGQSIMFSIFDQNLVPVPDPNALAAPGTYYVQGTDFEGNYYGTFTIILYPAVLLGPDQVVEVCNLSTPVDLTALYQLPGLTLDWSLDGVPIPASTAAAANVAGIYQLVGQSANGCKDTAMVTLNATGILLGPDQSATICTGTSADLTAMYQTIGATDTWYYGGNIIPAPVAASINGIYTLVSISASGCADTAEVTLNLLPPVALGADQTASLCSNTMLDLTGLYATTGLTASWTMNNQPVDPASVNAAGTYTLIAGNGSGCADTASVTVTISNPPLLGGDQTAEACEGSSIDLTSNFNTAGLVTTWMLAGSIVPDPAHVAATGAYTLVATNSAGCIDTAQVDVIINPNPFLGADQSITACDGQSVDLGSLYATAPQSAAWTVNNLPVPDPSAVTSTGSYLLTVTSAEGCSSMATVDLVFVPAPGIGADMAMTICADSLVDLTGLYPTAGLSASWSVGGAAVTYPSGVALSGTYQLVVSNVACTDTALLMLTVNENPSIGPDQSFSLCPWQTVDLGSLFQTGGLSTTYTLNGEPVANPDSVHQAGVYLVTATNSSGCRDRAQAIISNMECICKADFLADARCLQEPSRFILLADSAVHAVQWDFGGAAPNATVPNPEVRFGEAQDVMVKLQATLSCGVVNVERVIQIQDCTDSCHVWFPNSFSPDEDGVNDSWNWTGDCVPAPFSLHVFDRWGKALFTTSDPFAGWDGTSGGSAVPPGIYVYRANYQLPYQDSQEATGTITLVK